jgi:hypothetical protein
MSGTMIGKVLQTLRTITRPSGTTHFAHRHGLIVTTPPVDALPRPGAPVCGESDTID